MELKLRSPPRRFINAYRFARHWKCGRWHSIEYAWMMATMRLSSSASENKA